MHHIIEISYHFFLSPVTLKWDKDFNAAHRMKAEVVLTDCRINQRRNQSLTTPHMAQRAAWYHQTNLNTRQAWRMREFIRPQPGVMSTDRTRVNQIFAPDRYYFCFFFVFFYVFLCLVIMRNGSYFCDHYSRAKYL